jgi:hypothetical protein
LFASPGSTHVHEALEPAQGDPLASRKRNVHLFFRRCYSSDPSRRHSRADEDAGLALRRTDS